MNNFELDSDPVVALPGPGIAPRRRDRAAVGQARAEEHHREHVLEAWKATLPGEFAGHSLDEVKESSWEGRIDRGGRIALRRYLDEPSRFLLLHGDAGLGKSTLGATIVTELVRRRGVPATFLSAALWLHRLSFGEDRVTELDEAIEPQILMLDDVGSANESLTPHQHKCLWALLDARWSDTTKHTIITTNLGLKSNRDGIGLPEYVGETAWSRISDGLVRINLTGESFRGL